MRLIRFALPALVFVVAGSCSLERYHQEYIPQPFHSTTQKSMTLPQKCRPLLNDPSDAWIDCMGVGKK